MATPNAGISSRLVQYVVVRSDLVHELSWPLGAVVTQACHAATAVIHLHYGDPHTQRYLAELDSMHKVVLGVSSVDNAVIYRLLFCDKDKERCPRLPAVCSLELSGCFRSPGPGRSRPPRPLGAPDGGRCGP